MAIGPGKYDKLAEMCLATTGAKAVLVIVFEGNRGSGMSTSIDLGDSKFDVATLDLQIARQLPGLLRHVANTIEKDTARTH